MKAYVIPKPGGGWLTRVMMRTGVRLSSPFRGLAKSRTNSKWVHCCAASECPRSVTARFAH